MIARDDGAWGFRSVNSEIVDAWIHDKNREVAWAMPPWLSNGLRDYVRGAYAKGGRLDFVPDTDEIVSLKVAAKSGKLIKPKEMLTLTYDEIMEKEKAAAADPANKPGLRGFGGFGGGAYGQLSGLFRYLIAGPGSKNPRTRDLLKNYIKSLQDLVGEDKPAVVASSRQRRRPRRRRTSGSRSGRASGRRARRRPCRRSSTRPSPRGPTPTGPRSRSPTPRR